MNKRDDEQYRRSSIVAYLFVAVIVMSALLWQVAGAAARIDEWQVTMSRGSTSSYLIFKGATAAEAHSKCVTAVPQNASPAITYVCGAPRLVMVLTPVSPVTCQAPPPPRQVACPSGTQGTYTQSATVGPAPSCSVTWSPLVPSPPSCPSVPVTPSGTATLNWQHDGLNVDGFRIVYGPTADAMVNTVQLASPTQRAFVLTRLPASTMYFAVKAYQGATESASSNVVSKVIP